MKHKILSLLLAGIAFFITGSSVHAADITVTCTSSSCSPSVSNNFFPASEVWYPGKSLTKTIQFTNTASTTQTIDNHAANAGFSGTANVANVIDFTVRRVSTNTIVWFGTLQSFYSTSSITLGDITSGSSDVYEYTGVMRESAGNEYQDTLTRFDLVYGINTADGPTPTPTVCTATKPSTPGSPSLSQLNASDVKVTWNSVSDPKTGYIVSWGTNTGADNAGSRFTGSTEMTILGLNLSSTRYYFKVQAVNSCATGDYSGVSSIGSGPDLTSSGGSNPTPTPSTGGTVAGASTIASFFGFGGTSSVLGDDDATVTPTEDPTPSPRKRNTKTTGEVQGAKVCADQWWWWIVVLGYVLAEVILVTLRRHMTSKVRLLINVAVTLVTGLLLYIALCFPWPWILAAIVISIIAQTIFRAIKIYKEKASPLVKKEDVKPVK